MAKDCTVIQARSALQITEHQYDIVTISIAFFHQEQPIGSLATSLACTAFLFPQFKQLTLHLICECLLNRAKPQKGNTPNKITVYAELDM